jgi:hypothetical protein
VATKRKEPELDEDDADEAASDAPQFSVVSQWPTGTKAAVQLGVSAKKLSRLVADGSLRTYKAHDRTVRYNPEELDALRKDLEALEVDSPGDTTEERRATVELMKAQTEALRDCHKMIRDLVGMVKDPIQIGLSLSESLTAKALERAAELERMRDEYASVREEALSSQAERDVILLREKAQEERRTKAFEMAMQSAPNLMRGIEGTLLKYMSGGGGAQKLQAASRLISSFDPGMVAGLLAMGILNDEQSKDLRAVLPPETLKLVDAILAKGEDVKGDESRC